MEHRHITDTGWTVQAVHSCWERGSDEDIIDLLVEIRARPHGLAADSVERAAPHSDVYGYPAMFLLALERFRQGLVR